MNRTGARYGVISDMNIVFYWRKFFFKNKFANYKLFFFSWKNLFILVEIEHLTPGLFIGDRGGKNGQNPFNSHMGTEPIRGQNSTIDYYTVVILSAHSTSSRNIQGLSAAVLSLIYLVEMCVRSSIIKDFYSWSVRVPMKWTLSLKSWSSVQSPSQKILLKAHTRQIVVQQKHLSMLWFGLFKWLL